MKVKTWIADPVTDPLRQFDLRHKAAFRSGLQPVMLVVDTVRNPRERMRPAAPQAARDPAARSGVGRRCRRVRAQSCRKLKVNK